LVQESHHADDPFMLEPNKSESVQQLPVTSELNAETQDKDTNTDRHTINASLHEHVDVQPNNKDVPIGEHEADDAIEPAKPPEMSLLGVASVAQTEDVEQSLQTLAENRTSSLSEKSATKEQSEGVVAEAPTGDDKEDAATRKHKEKTDKAEAKRKAKEQKELEKLAKAAAKSNAKSKKSDGDAVALNSAGTAGTLTSMFKKTSTKRTIA
jgi:hypothetical protein